MDTYLRIRLRASRVAAAWVAVAACATFAVLAAAPHPPLPHALAAIWIAASALQAYRTVALLRGVRAFELNADEIEVEDGLGVRCEGEIRDGSFVAPWLTIVRWRPRGAAFDRTILVLPDMLPAPLFRELRVLLRAG